ncbi:MAG: DUF434 domain-containing protein [Planctomycetota bacterium]
MPDRRIHRGPNPKDEKLFATDAVARLCAAVGDYSLLLTRGYAEKSAMKLVGDRFGLSQRQRIAVMRSACSDEQLFERGHRRVETGQIAHGRIAIDGYNVLITVEAALGGSVILKGRDGCYRDMASVHGTYRKVNETRPALELVGSFLEELAPRDVLWLLDSPVSNSGRLKMLMLELAGEKDWNWQVDLATSPDAVLKQGRSIAATSDSAVLDGCGMWVNLAAEIIRGKLPQSRLVDLSGHVA